MEEDLRICMVRPLNDIDRRFCFEVISPTKSHVLQVRIFYYPSLQLLHVPYIILPFYIQIMFGSNSYKKKTLKVRFLLLIFFLVYYLLYQLSISKLFRLTKRSKDILYLLKKTNWSQSYHRTEPESILKNWVEPELTTCPHP